MKVSTNIPFRFRMGLVGQLAEAEREAIEQPLKTEVLNLCDEESKRLLKRAKHTPLAFSYVNLTDDTLNSIDLVLVTDDHGIDIDVIARQLRRPVVMVSKTKPTGFTVARGNGLSAHAVTGIERFNAYSVTDTQQQAYLENLYNDVFSVNDGLPNDVKQSARDELMPFYVRASLLAKSNQAIYHRAGVVVYSFSALAVGAVAIGTLVRSLTPWAFLLELLFLLTIVAVILRTHFKHAHKNWIEARYVTERIRAAIFLTACGVKTSTVMQPANVGVTGRPDEWMIMVFNEIIGRLNVPQPSAVKALVDFVRQKWVKTQIDFHEDKARSAKRKGRLLEGIGLGIFSTAVIAALAHLLLHRFHFEALEDSLTFAAIFLPAAGAAMSGIRVHREYSRLAERSTNMTQSLRALKDELSDHTSYSQLTDILVRVEALTLLELQDWLMLMSLAKLEASA
ncbi:MAG TPA: hypothetical protein VGJ37_02660 [Pyrinomonadaceae bacterium]